MGREAWKGWDGGMKGWQEGVVISTGRQAGVQETISTDKAAGLPKRSQLQACANPSSTAITHQPPAHRKQQHQRVARALHLLQQLHPHCALQRKH